MADSRIPNSVAVLSSINSYSGAELIDFGNFETPLGTFPLGVSAFSGTALNTDATFATLAVDAPSGTQSVMFWFFSVQDGKGERIVEVQAFVPEPSAFTLALLGNLGLVQRRRR